MSDIWVAVGQPLDRNLVVDFFCRHAFAVRFFSSNRRLMEVATAVALRGRRG